MRKLENDLSKTKLYSLKKLTLKSRRGLRREASSDCLVCSRFKIEYFDDKKKEFWFDRTYYAKIGNITISSDTEKDLREFIKQLDVKVFI